MIDGSWGPAPVPIQVRSVQVQSQAGPILHRQTGRTVRKRKMSFEMLASLKSSEMNLREGLG
jgi:hypothetical protein